MLSVLSLLLILAGPLSEARLSLPIDVQAARALKIAQPHLSASQIAGQVFIGDDYKSILNWMRGDLQNYAAHFDVIFTDKLMRIQRHQLQRAQDFERRIAFVRDQAEIDRLYQIHKPHGFVSEYRDATDFSERFVGPTKKLLKTPLTPEEVNQMNLGGSKFIYVDTWAVPFFNTGTQTRENARANVQTALKVFEALDLNQNISILRFTELMALFARPEFDDVRRYKLSPFPTAQDLARFGQERSDAKTFGDHYPEDALIVTNRSLDIDPVSTIFGKKAHVFGVISHAEALTADGRIFTGPADFNEHDYAHAFFNLFPAIPGTPDEWDEVHNDFDALENATADEKRRLMRRLTYYHFTHESGFRVLLPDRNGEIDLAAYRAEREMMLELIRTRYHYDFVLERADFGEQYAYYLDDAFEVVSSFFRDRFLNILQNERRKNGCLQPLIFVNTGTKDSNL